MYAELQVTTHFSFLRGASSCEELFAAAALLGDEALGVTDRNSVAGIVRAWDAAKATGVRLVPGCRLDLASGESLLVWRTDRAAWCADTLAFFRAKLKGFGVDGGDLAQAPDVYVLESAPALCHGVAVSLSFIPHSAFRVPHFFMSSHIYRRRCAQSRKRRTRRWPRCRKARRSFRRRLAR